MNINNVGMIWINMEVVLMCTLIMKMIVGLI